MREPDCYYYSLAFDSLSVSTLLMYQQVVYCVARVEGGRGSLMEGENEGKGARQLGGICAKNG